MSPEAASERRGMLSTSPEGVSGRRGAALDGGVLDLVHEEVHHRILAQHLPERLHWGQRGSGKSQAGISQGLDLIHEEVHHRILAQYLPERLRLWFIVYCLYTYTASKAD